MWRQAAKEDGWNKARQFLNFYNHILMPGKTRDLWLEAVKKGIGNDEPIDPQAPNDGDPTCMHIYKALGGRCCTYVIV